MAHDKSTDHEHGKVILNDVGFSKSGNRIGTHCAHPDQGHGEHREGVSENPNDAVDTVRNPIFEIDGEQGEPFA